MTKENSEYMGIDISRYLFLSSAEKDKVHQIIRNAKSEARTIDELVEEINLAIDKI